MTACRLCGAKYKMNWTRYDTCPSCRRGGLVGRTVESTTSFTSNQLQKMLGYPEIAMPPKDAYCHRGLVTQEQCGHCSRIAEIRTLISRMGS